MLLDEITESTAADSFRCDALSCRMSGTACAKTHVLARRTRDVARRVCVFCPLGARRATLLKIGEPLCRAVDQGAPCRVHAQPGSKYCAAHSHRGVAPKVKLDIAPALFTPGGQDWEVDLPEPTRPVVAEPEVEHSRAPRVTQPELTHAVSPLPPLPPASICACGEPYCLGRKRGFKTLAACAKCVKRAIAICTAMGEPLLESNVQARLWSEKPRRSCDYCGGTYHPERKRHFKTTPACPKCVNRAVAVCKALGEPPLEEFVRGRLGQDPPKKIRGVCARCGASAPPGAALCPICVTTVVKVFWMRFARRISRQEAQTAYLELPPKRKYTSRKTRAALNCAP